MSDIKVVLYKGNRAPRSLALSTGMLYRTLFAALLFGLLVVLSLALATRFYVLSREKLAQRSAPITQTADSELGPSNSPEEQNKALRDQIDALNHRLQNAAKLSGTALGLDKNNAALALFSPVVVDKTRSQEQVEVKNFRYFTGNGKAQTSLTFELHNATPGASVEKGYIVVLGRGETGLLGYPNVFQKRGPFLLDFEHGETFQVARFRLVNAQFDGQAQSFQILIFTRSGELLINTMYEARANGT